ncbi:MAG: tetratricopeptide repeat protein, partial [Bauldia sp.]
MTIWIRLFVSAFTAVAVAFGLAGAWGIAFAQQKPKDDKPAATPTFQQYADICQGFTGATAPEKVIACTEAIKTGKLTGGELALVYLNRGLSDEGKGSDVRSKADYKAALRLMTDAINGAPTNAYLYIQRGSIYQSIGEADRAILDYSDAIRLAPNQTYPLINRGIVLYTRKDNNEGAIADLTAALRINAKEISAWVNRGIVYRKKGDFAKALPDFDEAIRLLPPKIEPVQTKLVSDAASSPTGKATQDANRIALLA